jgi:hypothetical protein
MDLTAYEKLAKRPANKIGVRLPKLQKGTLQIRSSLLTYDELVQKFRAFAPEQGWVLARDRVIRAIELPQAIDLLEGEFCHGEQSLHLQLVAEGKFRCTQFLTERTGDMVYREQAIFAREKGGLTAVYRLWWQLSSKAEDEGRLRPLAQQFIGFVSQHDTEAS